MNELSKTESKVPKLRRADLSGKEKRAVALWIWSGGDEGKFRDLEGLNRTLWPLLNTDKVRRYIKQLSDAGKCPALVADKEEIEQMLTGKIRKFHDLDSMKHLSAMKGYIPKESNGGTVVQILLTGQIGVPEEAINITNEQEVVDE